MVDWKLVNKLRPHNTKESMKHFIIKSMVFKLLFNEGYFVYSEYQVKKGRVADIYANKKDERIIVEVETKPTKKNNQELMEFYQTDTLYIINSKKISDDINKMEKQLKHILGL